MNRVGNAALVLLALVFALGVAALMATALVLYAVGSAARVLVRL